ncbi:phosphodiester glycosidase family protein [Glaciimonas soli]|uniref:Phosphodiester glycosidase domain-containing protein n=1 Tax=Glaciimonas soli TaxID=2590999 RepID=A0A843YUM6_9BURK|nr:phosphodiester glycosidase family protein [Glaciimonas soli]MQR01011.1 hypothetical protein [Glaciimonas soli]
MKSNRRYLSLNSLFFCGFLALTASRASGAELIVYNSPNLMVSVCKIDLLRDTVRMFWKDDNKLLLGRFSRLQTWLHAQGEDVVCATNAGIYQQDYRPLGLYIENGVTQRQLNVRKNAYGNFYIQPNGIFLIRDKKAEIIDTDRFAAERDALLPGVLYATQSGPLLLQNGKINATFSAASDNRLIRNAVCITSPHDVVLAIAREPVNFYEFAQFLRDKISCTDALYLDGSISRMYPGEDAEIGPDFGVLIAATKKKK